MEFARQVEHVIKDQGMADAFDMMEDYIHFLVDRVVQLQKNKSVSWISLIMFIFCGGDMGFENFVSFVLRLNIINLYGLPLFT